MKSNLIVRAVALVIVCIYPVATARTAGVEAPFHRGVNLTGLLQVHGAGQIQLTPYTEQDFENIKSLGCDAIRLRINLYYMKDGAPDHRIDPLFFYFLDQIVDWSEEVDLHLILCNEGFYGTHSTDPHLDEVLVPVWTQMAEHYRDRSMRLYYEIINEPCGIDPERWGEIQRIVIEAIRRVDPVHTIVVTPQAYSSYNKLQDLPVYADDNLLYTFHFYDPFVFTCQGASWSDPPLIPLAGVPFPYDAANMPPCPDKLKGTWVEDSLASYPNDGTVSAVQALLDVAVEFRDSRGVPVYCGEFGVCRDKSDNDDRVRWYEAVRRYLEEKGIAWTMHDYRGGYGLFKAGSNELFEHDLNVPLLEALGLEVPEQTPLEIAPETAGFDLYEDFIAEGAVDSGFMTQGIVDYYCVEEPAEGLQCIYATGLAQYNAIAFSFRIDKDMTLLVAGGSALEFWIRGDTRTARIEVRFLDSKTADPEDHPWRMVTAIDGRIVGWDGQWHHVRIPLADLRDRGAWDDGAWFNPQGAFDWSAVDRFEIAAEYHDWLGMQFWFDRIRITDPTLVNAQ